MKMLDVIRIIDFDYNNSGQYTEFYKKAKTGQIIQSEELSILEIEGVNLNVVKTVTVHEY